MLPVLVAIGGVRRGEGRDIRGAAGVPPVRVAPMRVAKPGRGARGSQGALCREGCDRSRYGV